MARMRARSARRVAIWSFVALLALSVVALWMIATTLDRPVSPQWGFRGFEVVLGLSFGSVGALIAANRPDNRLGWLILATSVVLGIQGVVDQYPVFADAAVPPLPWAGAARWVAAWIWPLASVPLVTVMPLIFPTGRLPSARWRPAAVLALTALAVLVGSTILASQPLGPVPPSTDATPYFEQLGPIMGTPYLLFFAATAVSVSSLVQRYRRATGDERLQIRWHAYAAVLVVPGVAVGVSPLAIGQVAFIAVGVVAAGAIGISILRYRLYDIDVIISRTLVYGAVSAILAGVYAASITLTQRLFLAITGTTSNDAAIVLTTLIVAATFNPLKARIEAVVDRRIKPREPAAVALDPATVAAVLDAAEDRLREIAREEVSKAPR
jgi:hypothetical protein